MPDVVQVLLNSIFAFAYLFLIAKILGKKQVAQLTVVDYVVGISIGSIAAEWCTDAKTPWYFYAIGMGIFFLFSFIIDFLERKTLFKKFLKGKELELMSDGKINYKNLKKSKLDINDILGLCREKNYFDLSEIAYIYFENNGAISILPKGNKRPATANDLIKVDIKKASPSSYVIIDGNINKSELDNLGKDNEWLLKKCNISNEKELKNIILAEYIEDTKSVSVHYKKETNNN
ncbi:MAG: DUF421 domain-containing protein [Christensenellales bacterium]